MEYIQIRSLQHFLYCPHRWGLIEIDRAWHENYFVVKANLLHERTHSGEHYFLRGKTVYTDVDIWNDELGLIGKTDCLEEGKEGLCVVEYKPTKPKEGTARHEDAVQLYAQKLCVDEIFKTDCATQIYYADVKRRFEVTFESTFPAELKAVLNEMRSCIEIGEIPPIRKGQNCNGCSMKDMCIPQIMKSKGQFDVKALITKENEL